jgi:RNA polymerase sigma-70 factor (ECF subfamily)
MGVAGEDFEGLMTRVRAGCPLATQELLERYSDDVRRAVRRRLDRRLRPQYDSLDFVQSVWASFIQIPADRYTFETSEHLVAFLARVAFTKVVEAYRQRLRTAKRDLRREEACPAGPDLAHGRRSPEPTPSQVVIAQERWEHLVRGLPEKYQRIVALLRQGHSKQEAADAVGLNVRLVHRLLQKLTKAVK